MSNSTAIHERAMLSLLINSPQGFDAYSENITPALWADPLRVQIATQVLKALSEGITPNPAVISAGLNAPATAELRELLAEHGRTPVSVGEHLPPLQDAHRRRLLRAVLAKASAAVDAMPLAELAVNLQREVDGVLAGAGSQSEMSYGELFESTWEELERRAEIVSRDPTRAIFGIPSGFPSLDELTGGWQASHYILCGGRPSMGKTAFLLQLARNAGLSGAPVGIFSYEMAASQLMERAIASESGESIIRLNRGRLGLDALESAYRITRRLAGLPIFVVDQSLTLEQLEIAMRRMVRTRGVQLFIVDYVNIITHGRIKDPTERLTEISLVMKKISKALNVAIIVACQLNRGVESRENQRPILSDLKQSGGLEQDADIVLFVHREEYFVARRKPAANSYEYPEWQQELARWTGIAEILVRKNRHGPIGEVELLFDAATNRFSPKD